MNRPPKGVLMNRAITKILVALPLLFSLSSAKAAETSEVWQHHIDTWNARDVEGIVADYTEESVVIMVNKVYRGKKEIRELFVRLFDTFDGAEDHEIDPAFIIGKVVYITWRAKIEGIAIPLGTDTFVIEDGKILYQTITSNPILF